MPPSLASRIQGRLSTYYGLDALPAVDDFVRPAEDGREALLIREHQDDGLELALHLPREALEPHDASLGFDAFCQVVEGVSHFVYVAERARRELPATQLELELQAEVDKYVLLALGEGSVAPAAPGFAPEHAARVRARLYERVRFVHPAGTEVGQRYRMANDLAARFARRLEASFAARGRFGELRRALRRFYAAGQREKIELARAA
jgi:hypothetical protein